MYYRLGQLAAMGLVQGGAAIRALLPSVYSFMCGKHPCDIIVAVDEVSDESVRGILTKVSLLFYMKSLDIITVTDY